MPPAPAPTLMPEPANARYAAVTNILRGYSWRPSIEDAGTWTHPARTTHLRVGPRGALSIMPGRRPISGERASHVNGRPKERHSGRDVDHNM